MFEDNKKGIADRLVKIQKELKLTNKEMSNALHISKSSLMSYKNGYRQIHYDNCMLIVESFDVNPDYFFFGDLKNGMFRSDSISDLSYKNRIYEVEYEFDRMNLAEKKELFIDMLEILKGMASKM